MSRIDELPVLKWRESPQREVRRYMSSLFVGMVMT